MEVELAASTGQGEMGLPVSGNLGPTGADTLLEADSRGARERKKAGSERLPGIQPVVKSLPSAMQRTMV